MTIPKKSKTSKTSKTDATQSHASHISNQGDQTMKTTTKTHATNANTITNQGETTMKTTKTSHAHTSIAPTVTTQVASTTAAADMPNAALIATTAATLAYIQHCTTLVDQLEAAFPHDGTPTSKDKKHKAKARKGSERFTPQLVALATQHGVNLKTVPLDAISSASAEATALVPLQKRLEGLATKAAARMFALQSAAWSGSAKLYSVMRRLSKDDGDIETGLVPVEQFFNHRHPSVAKKHPKTKKGKAALAAEKAAAAEKGAAGSTAAPAPVTAPTEAPVPMPVTTPVATPAIATNGAPHA